MSYEDKPRKYEIEYDKKDKKYSCAYFSETSGKRLRFITTDEEHCKDFMHMMIRKDRDKNEEK